MTGTNTAGQVPGRYDVVIDGYGYVVWNGLLQNLPFRYQRAAFSYTKTFIERLGTSGPYGDDDQAFFLTSSQNDWSEGDGQRFYRGADKDRSRRYWQGYAVDPVTVPGQVTIGRAIKTLSPAADIICSTGIPGTPSGAGHAIVSTANLYTVAADGTITSIGAHGAGAPRAWGVTRDAAKSPKIYIAGATSIRIYDANLASFADFSATADAGTLAFHNNQLYSCDGSSLCSYDSSGNQTVVFTWKDAQGTALAANTDPVRLVSFGGVLLIWWPALNGQPQLWQYDGSATRVLAQLPQSAVGFDCIVVEGVVFLSGVIQTHNTFQPQNADAAVAVIWSYVNGGIDELWRAEMPASSAGPAAQLTTNPALGTYGGKVTWFDASYGLLMYGLSASGAIRQYDIEQGAVTTLGLVTAPTSTAGTVQFSSKVHSLLLTFSGAYSGSDSAFLYPDAANVASVGILDLSAIDFDNSLTKIFRSVRLDWEGAGTVDIAYALDTIVNSSTGAWTNLQTGAVAGTEYILPTTALGHELGVRLTLNPGGGVPPVVKRVYVRAVPIQQTYRRVQYVLDLSGRQDRGEINNPVPLRDGTYSTLSGVQMRANLLTTMALTAPFSVTDEVGTFTAVFEQGEGISEIDLVRPGEYLAQVTLREV